MNNENNPKLNESQLVENIDVNQSGEAPKAVKKLFKKVVFFCC